MSKTIKITELRELRGLPRLNAAEQEVIVKVGRIGKKIGFDLTTDGFFDLMTKAMQDFLGLIGRQAEADERITQQRDHRDSLKGQARIKEGVKMLREALGCTVADFQKQLLTRFLDKRKKFDKNEEFIAKRVEQVLLGCARDVRQKIIEAYLASKDFLEAERLDREDLEREAAYDELFEVTGLNSKNAGQIRALTEKLRQIA